MATGPAGKTAYTVFMSDASTSCRAREPHHPHDRLTSAGRALLSRWLRRVATRCPRSPEYVRYAGDTASLSRSVSPSAIAKPFPCQTTRAIAASPDLVHPRGPIDPNAQSVGGRAVLPVPRPADYRTRPTASPAPNGIIRVRVRMLRCLAPGPLNSDACRFFRLSYC
jgi:hypothetical protein